MIDYRDRASVLVWVVLMGLAAQRLLTLPTRTMTANVLGSPITLTVTATTLLAAVLAGLVASGTEAVVRAHPRWHSEEPRRQRAWLPHRPVSVERPEPALTDRWESAAVRRFEPKADWQRGTMPGRGWVFWASPIALVLVALLLLPEAPSLLYWLLGLILTGILLGLNLAGIYYTVNPFVPGYRRARLGMNALTYGVALVLFLVVYRTRVRSILSATEITLLSGLLALELLRGSERPLSLVVLYAGITGLVLGQATWALNYWRLDSLTGGLVLLVLFYDMTGLAQHALQGRISRRVLLEFGLITIAALALIWKFAP